MSKMKWFESVEAGVVVVSLGNGDLLLECLREVAQAANIHTGVLMTGLGSLSAGHIHFVVSNEMPPRDQFVKLPGPLEMVGFSGIIAGYEPHVHISLMDKRWQILRRTSRRAVFDLDPGRNLYPAPARPETHSPPARRQFHQPARFRVEPINFVCFFILKPLPPSSRKFGEEGSFLLRFFARPQRARKFILAIIGTGSTLAQKSHQFVPSPILGRRPGVGDVWVAIVRKTQNAERIMMIRSIRRWLDQIHEVLEKV